MQNGKRRWNMKGNDTTSAKAIATQEGAQRKWVRMRSRE
jgi:hypothetical protein